MFPCFYKREEYERKKKSVQIEEGMNKSNLMQ